MTIRTLATTRRPATPGRRRAALVALPAAALLALTGCGEVVDDDDLDGDSDDSAGSVELVA